MNKKDILKLFPVVFHDWLDSRSCPLRKNEKRTLKDRTANAAVAKRLFECYPHYQLWFHRRGHKLIIDRRAKKKFLFLISPVDKTELPLDIQKQMFYYDIRSVHEMLLFNDFVVLRMQQILSDNNWKQFIELLHKHRIYERLRVEQGRPVG